MIAQNPKGCKTIRPAGKARIGAVVGMVMKQSKGLNPKMVQEQIRRKFSSAES